jgi:hypothetical protein
MNLEKAQPEKSVGIATNLADASGVTCYEVESAAHIIAVCAI